MVVLTALLLAICAFGCIRSNGSYKVMVCISNQTSDSFYMEYESFDGNKMYIFTVSEGTTLDARFVTKEGKLTCRITDKSGTEYYKSDDVQTGETTVTLDKKGEYRVILHGDDHSGGFWFSW